MRPDPDAGPNPVEAQTAAEFVAMLRALRLWSGLTFRQIERRAQASGDVLPHSTVSAALGRTTLPREELVTAIVRAVGCDKETVELWAATRRRLAMAAEIGPPVAEAAQWWPPQQAEAPPIDAPSALDAPVPAEPPAAEAPEPGGGDHDLPPLGIKPREYADGTLATAVQTRQHRSAWVGLHRRAAAGDDGERPRGFGLKDLVPPVVWRAGWSTRAMLGLLAIVLLAIVSGAIVRGIRDGIVADPPGGEVCCLDDDGGDGYGDPEPTDSPAPSPTGTSPTAPATPVVNPKPTPSPSRSPSPNPNPSPNPSKPPPAQNPQLTGYSSPVCVRKGDQWWVDIPVSASLSGASSGTSPTAMAGEADSMQTFGLSGSGTTSFSGQTSVHVGPYSPIVTLMGNIQWSVTVSVPGGAKVGTSGREGYRCN